MCLCDPVAAPLELTDLGTVRAFAGHVQREHGPIDVLLNCAGVFLSESSRETMVINAAAPALLTSILRPSTRTVSIITTPKGQAAVPYPYTCPEKLIEEYNKTGVPGWIDAAKRYVYTKQLLSCAMTHLASQGVGGQHVLLGPGSRYGIHSKLPPNTSRFLRFALWLQSFNYHERPSGRESIARAVCGEFDAGGSHSGSDGADR